MLHRVTTKYVCGVDLHAKTLTGVIMDLEGKIHRKGTVPCELPQLMELLGPYAGDVTVGVESTYNWYWLIDALHRVEVQCVLGHALYMSRKMSGKHKSDGVDAQGIADLLRTNQFPLAYSYPPEMRGVRDLLRRRHTFVRRRAGTLTHFQCSLHQEGCTEPLRNKLQYKSTRDSLVNLATSDDTRKMLQSDLAYIKGLDSIIDDLEKTVLQHAQTHNPKHLQALQTMPGCGEITALTLLYEMHTIDRFRSPQQFCSYSRVVRAENSSAGKDYGGSSSDKIGNADLKWAFSEIGVAMLRVSPPVLSWHQKQSLAHGKAGAHARLRHKIALAVYAMLKHDRVFDLEKFVGKEHMEGVEKKSPTHNGTHMSGPSCEPCGLIGAPPPSIVSTQSATIVDSGEPATAAAEGSTPIAPVPVKKRGRPALPRDSHGNIVRPTHPTTARNEKPASAAHQSVKKSGPNPKPALPTATPKVTEPIIVRNHNNEDQTPLRQLLPEHLAGLTQADLSSLLLSIVSNIATAAANPAHNWSVHGPDNSQLPSRLIGAAAVASSSQEHQRESNMVGAPRQ